MSPGDMEGVRFFPVGVQATAMDAPIPSLRPHPAFGPVHKTHMKDSEAWGARDRRFPHGGIVRQNQTVVDGGSGPRQSFVKQATSKSVKVRQSRT